MHPSQSQDPKSPRSASSSPNPPDEQTPPMSESPPLAEVIMDQHSATTLTMDSPTVSPLTEDVPTNPEENEESLSLAGDSADGISRQQPIPPASEPMQYRAIGLIRGQYEPSEEQFTRGMLKTEDGASIDAVLLGRVMSLVKKHLDLAQPHLWVVYPRTRDKDNALHAQIVGVWEPEKLNRSDEPASTALEGEKAPEEEETVEGEAVLADQDEAQPTPVEDGADSSEQEAQPQDGYFSIRGEILYASEEEGQLIVKIQQSPRKNTDQPKIFKLKLKGTLTGKVVGYFWDLNVVRQMDELVIQDGTMIALVPPRKKKAGESSGGRRRPGGPGGRRPTPGGGPAKKRWNGSRDVQPRQQGSDRPAAPQGPRKDIPKPVKRPKTES